MLLDPSEIDQRDIKAASRQRGCLVEGIESAFGRGAELHPGPQLLWEGMAEASSWLAPLLRANKRDGENDGSKDRHHWLAPGVSQGLLQPSQGSEKHLWSWVPRTSWQLVL